MLPRDRSKSSSANQVDLVVGERQPPHEAHAAEGVGVETCQLVGVLINDKKNEKSCRQKNAPGFQWQSFLTGASCTMRDSYTLTLENGNRVLYCKPKIFILHATFSYFELFTHFVIHKFWHTFWYLLNFDAHLINFLHC